MTEVKMTKEEAIEFAKKYLADRKEGYTQILPEVTEKLSMIEGAVIKLALDRAWDIASEYIRLDIIPYIYGDALD